MAASARGLWCVSCPAATDPTARRSLAAFRDDVRRRAIREESAVPSTGGTSGSPLPLLRWRGLRATVFELRPVGSHSHRRRAYAGHRRPSSRVALLLFVPTGRRRRSILAIASALKRKPGPTGVVRYDCGGRFRLSVAVWMEAESLADVEADLGRGREGRARASAAARSAGVISPCHSIVRPGVIGRRASPLAQSSRPLGTTRERVVRCPLDLTRFAS
jgi:hypothetical protein